MTEDGSNRSLTEVGISGAISAATAGATTASSGHQGYPYPEAAAEAQKFENGF